MRNYDPQKLAENIRMLRAKAMISQAELAIRIGVSKTTIQKYEIGDTKPGADNLVALCSALNCTPNDILGWS